jgi:hypothetical protein
LFGRNECASEMICDEPCAFDCVFPKGGANIMEIPVYASIKPIEIQEKQKGRTPASFHPNNLLVFRSGACKPHAELPDNNTNYTLQNLNQHFQLDY